MRSWTGRELAGRELSGRELAGRELAGSGVSGVEAGGPVRGRGVPGCDARAAAARAAAVALGIAAGIVLLLPAGAARAVPVAYAFTAVVTEVHTPTPLPEGMPGPGDTITGSFHYESDQTGRGTLHMQSFEPDPPANRFHLDLPSHLDFDGARLTLGVTDEFQGDPMHGAHLMRVGSEMRGGRAMGWPLDVSRVRADIMLWDVNGKLATGVRLPTSLDLASLTRAEFALIGSWGPNDTKKKGPLWAIYARVESLTPIAAAPAGPGGRGVATPASEPGANASAPGPVPAPGPAAVTGPPGGSPPSSR